MIAAEHYQQEANRLLQGMAPEGACPHVHMHPVKRGYFAIDLGDGETPIASCDAAPFVKWLSLESATWEELKSIICRKSGLKRAEKPEGGRHE